MYGLLRPFLFALDPETAHRASLTALAKGIVPRAAPPDPRLRRNLLGLTFPSPLGLAAGFDKDAEAPDAILSLGFGFVEVGTITPRPQLGNPRPRMFRLVEDRAFVNRYGFNSAGHEEAYRRLAERKKTGIVGVNIGANKDSADRIADYVAGVRRFSDVADYLAVNISSPNTPGLRDLQEKESLGRLLGAVAEERAKLPKGVPILLKIAPDLDEDALAGIVDTAVDAGLEGMIVSNTTTARTGLSSPLAKETGGLSGRPQFAMYTDILSRTRAIAGNRLVLVGTGGIDSPATAAAKLDAGADLIQLYSGMVYEGPDLPARINTALAAKLP